MVIVALLVVLGQMIQVEWQQGGIGNCTCIPDVRKA